MTALGGYQIRMDKKHLTNMIREGRGEHFRMKSPGKRSNEPLQHLPHSAFIRNAQVVSESCDMEDCHCGGESVPRRMSAWGPQLARKEVRRKHHGPYGTPGCLKPILMTRLCCLADAPMTFVVGKVTRPVVKMAACKIGNTSCHRWPNLLSETALLWRWGFGNMHWCIVECSR